jgi:pyrroline-5-carboxylate reductase
MTDERAFVPSGRRPGMNYVLGLIGAGTIGQSIARGAIASRVIAPGEMLVAEPDPVRLAQASMFGCAVTDRTADVSTCDQLLFAVKPQVFPNVARELAPLTRPTLVMSVMAGISSAHIRDALGEHARVIRIMPNTPCQVGEGMTGIALGEGAAPGDEKLALALFEALGRTVIVEESLMHAVTAISGSGPAYIYLIAELMEKAAVDLGFDATVAQMLVIQTIIGAGRMLRDTAQDPQRLRELVTTPGGTTQAAMTVMFERDLPRTLLDALRAARDRGQELDVL